jgi:hypothetical protein
LRYAWSHAPFFRIGTCAERAPFWSLARSDRQQRGAMPGDACVARNAGSGRCLEPQPLERRMALQDGLLVNRESGWYISGSTSARVSRCPPGGRSDRRGLNTDVQRPAPRGRLDCLDIDAVREAQQRIPWHHSDDSATGRADLFSLATDGSDSPVCSETADRGCSRGRSQGIHGLPPSAVLPSRVRDSVVGACVPQPFLLPPLWRSDELLAVQQRRGREPRWDSQEQDDPYASGTPTAQGG